MSFGSRRRSRLSTAFVLALIVCLLLFAIYLKAAAPGGSLVTGSSSQVKFWVKTTPAQNIKLKLATVDAFVLMPPAVFSVIQGNGPSQASTPDLVVPFKDAFVGSCHWFRPPPLS